jgi:polysaccharide biosynthesis transport protein
MNESMPTDHTFGSPSVLPLAARSSPAIADASTFRAFTSVLRRHRVLMIGCLVLASLLATAYTFWATRVFEATSVLRIEVEELNLPQLVHPVATENRLSTEIEVLKGRSAAENVVDSLGWRLRMDAPRRVGLSHLFSYVHVAPSADTMTLVVSSRADRTFTILRPGMPQSAVTVSPDRRVNIRGVTLALRPQALGVREVRLSVTSRDAAVHSFGTALDVVRPARDADLIRIRIRTNDAARAAAAANLLAQHVIAERQIVQRARTGTTIQYLSAQLDTLGVRLRTSEDALSGYRKRADAVDPAEQSRTQVGRLVQLEAERGAVKAERDALAMLLRQVRSDSAQALLGGQRLSRSLTSFPTLFKSQATSQLLGALAQVENERSALMVRRTPNDPGVQRLTVRIHELNAQLEGIAETYLQGLTNQVGALEQVAAGFGTALRSLPEKAVRAGRLERDVQVQQELYSLLQTRLKEAEITRAMEDPTVRVVDRAVVPERYIWPLPLLNLALGIVLGSLLGVGAAIGRELSDRSVRSRADALLATGLPVLGAIPRLQRRPSASVPRLSRPNATFAGVRGDPKSVTDTVSGRAAAHLGSLLVTRSETSRAYAESFNQLYASLFPAHLERPPKIVVITSPLPGEGKTQSAINFALTLAARGLRVLLVDADFRCGIVNEVFGLSQRPGFAELLRGSARFEDVVQRVAVGESGALMVLPSGAVVQSSGGLPDSERLREALDALGPQFDLILIDTPPINLLSDAVLLGSTADAVLLIARAGHTRVEALRYAVDQLSTAQAKVVGVVLNDIDVRRHADDDGTYRYLSDLERYYARQS